MGLKQSSSNTVQSEVSFNTEQTVAAKALTNVCVYFFSITETKPHGCANN